MQRRLQLLVDASRRFARSADGNSMVELAIAGGILSVFIIGILEAGLAAWQRNSVTADAREGARYAAVHGGTSGSQATTTTVRNYVLSKTSLPRTGSNVIRVYASWPDGMMPGAVVSVSVAHDVPRRGIFIPAHTDSATSKMVILF